MNELSFKVVLSSLNFDLGVFKCSEDGYFIDLVHNASNRLCRSIEASGQYDRKNLDIFRIELTKWTMNPMIEIKCSETMKVVCPIFVADASHLFLEFDTEESLFKLTNQGIRVVSLDPKIVYIFSLTIRNLEPQRSDLVGNWDGNTRIDVLFLPRNKSGEPSKDFYYDIDSLFERLLKLIDYSGLCQLWVSIGNIKLRLSLIHLKNKKLISLDGVEYEIRNYTVFSYYYVNQNLIGPHQCTLLSFDSQLNDAGIFEKNRLIDCICSANLTKKTATDCYHVPFINVCQSAGTGKTRIASEVMKEMPSAYIVIRKDTDEYDKYSYPEVSKLSKMFISIFYESENIHDNFYEYDSPSNSIVGRYLLLLKALMSDLLETYESLAPFPKSLETVARSFLEGDIMGRELKLLSNYTFRHNAKIYFQSGTFILKSEHDKSLVPDKHQGPITVSDVIKACNHHLKQFELLKFGKPFVLVVDGASLLKEITTRRGSNLFNLFRVAVQHLDLKNDFMVLTLGTDLEIFNINSILKISPRQCKEWKLFPPFILNRIWDVSFNFKELDKTPIGYKSLRCVKMMNYLISLGRPFWSSKNLDYYSNYVGRKLQVDDPCPYETHLAFWMLRTGLLINPNSSMNALLIKSYSATLIYTTPALNHVRVSYPSEPAFAFIAGYNLNNIDNVKAHYICLENSIYKKISSNERASGLISMDVSLRSITKATGKKGDMYYCSPKLPQICSTRKFIFETRLPDIYDPLSQDLAKHHKDDYHIVSVEAFLISMYGKDCYDKLKPFIPDRLKMGLINANHFIQKDHDLSDNNVCDSITYEALAIAISRGAGISFPSNYSGLDYIIPVVLKPGDLVLEDDDEKEFIVKDENFEEKPEYTFIGVKVSKEVPENIENVVAKGAFSNHFVPCGCHPKSTCNCSFKIADEYYHTMLDNSLLLVQSMIGGENSGTDVNFNCISKLEMLPDYCGTKYKTISGNFKHQTANIVSPSCHFQPDVYISGTIKKNIELHVMFKSSSTVTIEKLTAIHSTGLYVFNHSNLLPREVADIATRIISSEKGIFNEIRAEDPKYNNLQLTSSSIVTRNNDCSYPLVSNLLRSFYKMKTIETYKSKNY